MEGDVLLAQPGVGIKEMMTVMIFVIIGMFTVIGFLGRMLINRIMEQFKTQFEEHRGRLDALERRSVDLDERLRRAASHEDILRLHGRMDMVSNTLAELKGSIITSGSMTQTIHEYLLNRKVGE